MADWLRRNGLAVLVVGGVMLLGVCSHALGLGRATQADVRAVETRVAERCR